MLMGINIESSVRSCLSKQWFYENFSALKTIKPVVGDWGLRGGNNGLRVKKWRLNMRVDVGNTVHCYHQPPTIITMASKPIKHPYNHCFDKHDLHIYARLHVYPFNCTRNSFHYHSTTCCSYRLQNLRIPTHGSTVQRKRMDVVKVDRILVQSWL